jgi:hypothetical protein
MWKSKPVETACRSGFPTFVPAPDVIVRASYA